MAHGEHPNRSPLASVMQSLLTGYVDHTGLPRLPDIKSRTFWIGAAAGAAAVMVLRARANGTASVTTRVTGQSGGVD